MTIRRPTQRPKSKGRLRHRNPEAAAKPASQQTASEFGRLTNGDLGTLVDALDLAAAVSRELIRDNLPPRNCGPLTPAPKNWSEEDREQHAEWAQDARVFAALRRRLRDEEKRR